MPNAKFNDSHCINYSRGEVCEGDSCESTAFMINHINTCCRCEHNNILLYRDQSLGRLSPTRVAASDSGSMSALTRTQVKSACLLFASNFSLNTKMEDVEHSCTPLYGGRGGGEVVMVTGESNDHSHIG